MNDKGRQRLKKTNNSKSVYKHLTCSTPLTVNKLSAQWDVHVYNLERTNGWLSVGFGFRVHLSISKRLIAFSTCSPILLTGDITAIGTGSFAVVFALARSVGRRVAGPRRRNGFPLRIEVLTWSIGKLAVGTRGKTIAPSLVFLMMESSLAE